MPEYTPNTERFFRKMADNNFGMLIVAGATGAGKTNVIKQYVQSFPQKVRISILDSNEVKIDHPRLHRFERDDGETELVEKLQEVTRTRPSVVACEDTQSVESLSFISNISTTTNTGITFHIPPSDDSLMELIESINSNIEHPDSEVNLKGFWKRTKGIVITARKKTNNGFKIFQECLEIDDQVRQVIGNPNMHPSELSTILRDIANNQGHLSIDQQVAEENNPKPIELSTQLAFKDFISKKNGSAVINLSEESGNQFKAVKKLMDSFENTAKAMKFSYI